MFWTGQKLETKKKKKETVKRENKVFFHNEKKKPGSNANETNFSVGMLNITMRKYFVQTVLTFSIRDEF